MKQLIFLGSLVSTLALCACSTADIQTLTTGGSANNVTAQHLAPTNPSNVKLYFNNDSRLPKHYKFIGRVSASNDNMLGVPHSEITIENKLKEEAASLGATSVIHINQGLEETSGDAIVSK